MTIKDLIFLYQEIRSKIAHDSEQYREIRYATPSGKKDRAKTPKQVSDNDRP